MIRTWVPGTGSLGNGLGRRQEFDDDTQAVSLIERMENRHKAASDHMAASQVHLGHLLEKRSVASRVVPGDKVWLDSKHTPIDIPYKLLARWFGPFEVLSSDGAAVTLDLGKAHRKVNIRRLKFYEERDSCFRPADVRSEPLIANGGVA